MVDPVGAEKSKHEQEQANNVKDERTNTATGLLRTRLRLHIRAVTKLGFVVVKLSRRLRLCTGVVSRHLKIIIGQEGRNKMNNSIKKIKSTSGECLI